MENLNTVVQLFDGNSLLPEQANAQKILLSIKPNEVRLQGWSAKLPELFNFEVSTFQKLLDEKIVLPVEITSDMTPDDIKLVLKKIPEYEAERRRIKSAAAETKKERIEKTKILDDFKARVMTPEKAYEDIVSLFESRLKPLKKWEEHFQKLEEEKRKRIKEFAERCIRDFNSDVMNTKTYASNKVLEYYNKCLEHSVNIEFTGFDLLEFNVKNPRSSKFADKEQQDEFDRVYSKWNEAAIIQSAKEYYDSLFSTYEFALKNKAKAKEIAEHEAAERKLKAEKEEQENNIVNQMSYNASMYSTSGPAEVKTAAIKRTWAVSIVENSTENMVSIISAFVALGDKTIPALKNSKIHDATVRQMAAAIASLKNKDENFEFQGISFYQLEKL